MTTEGGVAELKKIKRDPSNTYKPKRRDARSVHTAQNRKIPAMVHTQTLTRLSRGGGRNKPQHKLRKQFTNIHTLYTMPRSRKTEIPALALF
jgi:hypothetical protein